MGEKSSFLATCNLLSQFLKKKGSFSDLMAARASECKESSRPAITMSLLPALETSKDDDGSDTNKNQETNTDLMDLFPGFPLLNTTEIGKENSEQQKAQLTIFYSGRVLVFDDFPADKAKDLIKMAGKTSAAVKDFALALPSTSTAAVHTAADGPSTSRGGESQDAAAIDEQQKPAQANTSNMRVARRASLHKFLEKRKDRNCRITAKAPYQLNESRDLQAQKFDDTRSWLGFGESSKPSSSNESFHQDQE